VIEVKRIYTGQMPDYLDRELDLTLRGIELLPSNEPAIATSGAAWHGAGARLLGLTGQVVDRQIENLYVDGMHPDADRLVREYLATRPRLTAAAYASAYRSVQLGRRPGVFKADRPLRSALYQAYRGHNLALGVHPGAPIERSVRDAIRSKVAAHLFVEKHGRSPVDADELARSVRTMSRPPQGAVGAFEVSFPLGRTLPVSVIAHRTAALSMLESLETAAGFTRIGSSPHQLVVSSQGLVMAVFPAGQSFSGVFAQSIKVVVWSKVATREGQWLALDARQLYRALPDLRLEYAAALREFHQAAAGDY